MGAAVHSGDLAARRREESFVLCLLEASLGILQQDANAKLVGGCEARVTRM